MRKIPTLFQRKFEGHHVVGTLPIVTEGMEWVLDGEGIATVKWDGACCMIHNEKFFKRYDANVKKGRKVPDGAIPCQEEPDPVTGHFPCWAEVDLLNPKPEDKWFIKAFQTYLSENEMTEMTISNFMEIMLKYQTLSGTYEAIGRHFNGNPYGLSYDTLIRHGQHKISVPRTYYGIQKYLKENQIEGIVFWKDGIPQCKIKRTDFGFTWPVK